MWWVNSCVNTPNKESSLTPHLIGYIFITWKFGVILQNKIYTSPFVATIWYWYLLQAFPKVYLFEFVNATVILAFSSSFVVHSVRLLLIRNFRILFFMSCNKTFIICNETYQKSLCTTCLLRNSHTTIYLVMSLDLSRKFGNPFLIVTIRQRLCAAVLSWSTWNSFWISYIVLRLTIQYWGNFVFGFPACKAYCF